MFKEISDWVTLFAGILTVFAASATLYAVWIAHTTWRTWKHQQNYSFTRDKVFETEVIVNKVHTSLMRYINEYYNYKLKDIPSVRPIDPPYYQKLLGDCEKEYHELLRQYDIALNSLFILQVKYSEDVLVNYMFLEREYVELMHIINMASTVEVLIENYMEEILPIMQQKRKLALKHLRDIRNKI